MTPATERPTAQIIPFPVGGIRRLRERADRQEVKRPEEAARYSDLAFGGCWYHEEALTPPPQPNGKIS